MEKKSELEIFAEAIKMSLKFTLILSIIICSIFCTTIYLILNKEESISIQATQDDNTNSKQEIINGKTNN